ncbi:uncharacterized protein V6R79_025854 [Siganus canaliculatus]
MVKEVMIKNSALLKRCTGPVNKGLALHLSDRSQPSRTHSADFMGQRVCGVPQCQGFIIKLVWSGEAIHSNDSVLTMGNSSEIVEPTENRPDVPCVTSLVAGETVCGNVSENTMLRLFSKTLVKAGMVKNFHLLKPLSATVVAGRNLSLEGMDRLPVPPLKQTCELYLNMLEPIVEVDELKKTREIVKEFMKEGGVGEILQKGLETKARNTENWLTEDYVKHDYMEKRKPVVIFSNTGMLISPLAFNERDVGQISATLPIPYIGGKPICLKQLEHLMSSCRVPGLGRDSGTFYAKNSDAPKHIVVLRNGQFFKMDVYHSDGTVLTIDQLCSQLEKICEAAQEVSENPIGILTTQQRDAWGKAYINLTKDETNRESVATIERSIFTVSLDGAMPPVSEDKSSSTIPLQLLHGGGSKWNSGNRWFDKGMQIITAEDGTCGTNTAHSFVDGAIGLMLGDLIVEFMRKPEMTQPSPDPLSAPQKLHFNITPEIKKDIEEAKQHMDYLAQNLAHSVTVFKHFGKNALRAYKMSPDSFTQLAIQLAHYRMCQKCHPIMEPITLGMFKLGRVALVNSNTSASTAFVKAFDDPNKQSLEKVDLLAKAIKSHKRHISMGLSGQVTHAHLFGLEMQAIEKKIPIPDLFTDVSFKKIFAFRVSTSQVTSKSGCVPCIGPEETNVYNVGYGLQKDHIDFAVTHFDDSGTGGGENSSAHMAQIVQEALLDMKALLNETANMTS